MGADRQIDKQTHKDNRAKDRDTEAKIMRQRQSRMPVTAKIISIFEPPK